MHNIIFYINIDFKITIMIHIFAFILQRSQCVCVCVGGGRFNKNLDFSAVGCYNCLWFAHQNKLSDIDLISSNSLREALNIHRLFK